MVLFCRYGWLVWLWPNQAGFSLVLVFNFGTKTKTNWFGYDGQKNQAKPANNIPSDTS
jgi:hypothetical protein